MAHPVVNIRCGQLRGSKLKNVDGGEFCAFKGIPYAEPPIGDLRFQDPVPAEKWTGIRDALEFGPMSPQYDPMLKRIDGSEDCLYLNVYTKSTEPQMRRPVMVWIHGGGFHFGSGHETFYGPNNLMKKDIVLVTINYRLGVLGFLNLEDEIAPGNQGLKDQVMALRWVRENIEYFGGDPNNVTIFGESAGGASVHYMTLSPLAKGLFHKAISQSGVATCTWATVPGSPKEKAYQLSEVLGKKITDHKEIVKFLKSVDPMKLIEASLTINAYDVSKQCLYPFGPGVDAKSPNPFMPVPIDVAAEKGAHVPYLLGHNDREGTLLMQYFELQPSGVSKDMDADFINYLHPRMLKLLKENNLSMEDLKRLYFKSEKITSDNLVKLVDLIGDMHFNYFIHQIVKTQVQCNSAPTYMYQFTFDKGYSYTQLLGSSAISGATHMDDFYYLFNSSLVESQNIGPLKKGTADYKVMEQMVELWTEFARTGRPTPTTSELVPLYWLPVNDGTVLRYLNIGEELRMEKMLNINERLSFKKNEKST